MKPKHRRFITICAGVASTAAGLWILAQTLRTSLVYYVTPSELRAQKTHTNVRLGGLVVYGSVVRTDDICDFIISDGVQDMAVHYKGPVPTLFREGQGVVAEGSWCTPTFQAERLLVKHDASYRPPSKNTP